MSKNVRSPTSQGSHRTRTFETRISANQLFPPRYVYRIAPVSVVSDDDDVDDVVVPSLVDGDDDARARRVADAARAARRGIDARAREDVDAAALVSDDANATDDMTSAALRGVQCICYVEDDDHVEREPEAPFDRSTLERAHRSCTRHPWVHFDPSRALFEPEPENPS